MIAAICAGDLFAQKIASLSRQTLVAPCVEQKIL